METKQIEELKNRLGKSEENIEYFREMLEDEEKINRPFIDYKLRHYIFLLVRNHDIRNLEKELSESIEGMDGKKYQQLLEQKKKK